MQLLGLTWIRDSRTIGRWRCVQIVGSGSGLLENRVEGSYSLENVIIFFAKRYPAWTILQLTRDPALSRGFMSARTVTGFLVDVYATAADELGKIHIIADERVCIHFVLLIHFLLKNRY
ncbi:hypothetical protein L1887_15349 [Cichorium endivia]|nr:hypothetical protein L1887_15349 [Cichorium endivia]